MVEQFSHHRYVGLVYLHAIYTRLDLRIYDMTFVTPTHVTFPTVPARLRLPHCTDTFYGLFTAQFYAVYTHTAYTPVRSPTPRHYSSLPHVLHTVLLRLFYLPTVLFYRHFTRLRFTFFTVYTFTFCDSLRLHTLRLLHLHVATLFTVCPHPIHHTVVWPLFAPIRTLLEHLRTDGCIYGTLPTRGC